MPNINKKQRHKTITPSPFFIKVIKPFLHWLLPRLYTIQVIRSKELNAIHPPYIIVGNHVNFWDPFLLGLYIKEVPQFVTSDNIFRTRLFGVIMKLFGSIPKSKFMSDAATVAQIVRIIKGGGVIGIFPEGRRTWDGRSLEHVPQVSKLIQRLAIPVVGVRVKGAFLARPRWARKRSKGLVELEYFSLFSGEELKGLGWEEVKQLMEKQLFHDDVAWAREKELRFVGKRRAEYVEKLLYLCPSCEGVATLVSHDNTVECSSCGYAFTYDETGELGPVTGPLRFSELGDWNDWQQKRLIERICELPDGEQIFMEEGPAMLLTGYRAQRLKKLKTGRALFSRDTLYFRTTLREGFSFPVNELEAVNVQDKEKLEFYHKGMLFRLNFVSSRASALLWYRAITGVQECLASGNLLSSDKS
ncbi:1-acyl-sn-glycerol-3-phosphate acyltransferase [Sediminispirochaeta smaragdinae]|uniref:Phospholipid/glycerol acyltransferase n=1 Tax=Sediminispirochaeta smaragdinae (strain DSM 11293 / JCM 15392 / SEBR 4228) TaxID=573413 RepID=E1RAV6_SEDSS|nr:1-acyl-sn-glycerol-3-phosphate acyltransferase [Sediminispirochaeta smaragdinae]ADK79486.1 phospholipid/glycerol acyltransferase [Sediminispirochaeta smaragdinae DSM 11293]